jgi:hypothetical protein
MEEIWIEVPNTQKRYFISNFGNLKTMNWKNSKMEKIMKPASTRGYLHTLIKKGDKYKKAILHRLVAEAFIPNPENKTQINHKDFNRGNNRVENLEWVTPRENFDYSQKAGHCKAFEENIAKKQNLGVHIWIKRARKDKVEKIKKFLRPLRGEELGTSKLKEAQVLEIRKRFKRRIVTREILGKEFNVSPATIKDIVLRKSWTHI